MTPTSVAEGWQDTAILIGYDLDTADLDDLVRRYGEPHRAYHNLHHVLACLEQAREIRDQFVAPGIAELALWYHDAIYDPHRADNEERSAALATERLSHLPGIAAAVAPLILATKHNHAPTAGDEALVVDIDLSILGAPEPAFVAYDTAIRREYRWVPRPLYRRKRREILQSFLDRRQIFATETFALRLERQARANLTKAVAQLS